jgi:cell division transport system permease protein
VSLLSYSFEEAAASLRRGGRAALMSMATIAIAFLALGGFLLVSGNLQRMVQRWMEAAEVSVFLHDDLDERTREAIAQVLAARPAAERVDFVSKDQALDRFTSEFPELSDVATSLGRNPFPASFEVRLRPGPDVAGEAEALSAAVAGLDGVADVQFDRRWLERVLSLLAGAQLAGLAVAVVLLLGAAFTVAAVVRLSLHARREEIGIMQLVGAPMAVIRGPFVVEGLLLGGAGAVVALAVLGVAFWLLRGWVGPESLAVLGTDAVGFLTPGGMALLVVAGLAVGAAAGVVASRAAR